MTKDANIKQAAHGEWNDNFKVTDDGLSIYASMDDYADEEMLENLLATIGFTKLNTFQREFLLEQGYDPDTGQRFE